MFGAIYDKLRGYYLLWSGNAPLPTRGILELAGDVTLADDPTNKRTVATFAPGSTNVLAALAATAGPIVIGDASGKLSFVYGVANGSGTTPVVIASVAAADNCLVTGCFTVFAETPSVATYNWHSTGGLSKISSGTLTGVGGATIDEYNDGYGSSPSVDVHYDATNKLFQIRGIGIAATTIKWSIGGFALTRTAF